MPSSTFRPLLTSALTLALLAGCRDGHHDHENGHDHDGGHADEHGHANEPKTAQITVWTESHEVFAEHRAPVAGQPTTFITHVTDLRTLEPRRAGPVTFTLRQGETVAEHVEAAPARAGIYLPGLVFPRPGDWLLALVVPDEGTNAVVALGTIAVYASKHDAAHAEIADGPEGVSFLKEQQWKILSKTEPVSTRRLVERVRVPGRVRALPGRHVTVSAPLGGQLEAPQDQLFAQPGQRVEAGQLLAVLRPRFSETVAMLAEAKSAAAAAQAELGQATATAERVRKLAAEQAKSPREVQEAEAAQQAARHREEAAQALLRSIERAGGVWTADAAPALELRAPIAGTVNSVHAGPGETVAADQALLTVIDLASVWIEASVPEASVARLSEGKDAVIERPGRAGDFAPLTGAGRGRLVSAGLEVDAVTRTVPLLYEAANADGGLRAGQNVMLHIETARAEEAVSVPDAALVEEGDQKIAFVQRSGETFEKREVKTGLHDSGHWQVLEGLAVGERVVTRGAYAIRLSTLTGAIPAHGHAH